jgi:hypothetical protein
MDEKAAIGFILQKVNALDARTGYGIGEPGMATIKNVAQQTANKAVSDFMQNRDPGPLLDLIATVHAYGGITDKEYDQLNTTFQKET